MKKKLPKIDTYKILSELVENGVRFGYNKAHKHNDNPDFDYILENIHREIMNNICETFKFD